MFHFLFYINYILKCPIARVIYTLCPTKYYHIYFCFIYHRKKQSFIKRKLYFYSSKLSILSKYSLSTKVQPRQRLNHLLKLIPKSVQPPPIFALSLHILGRSTPQWLFESIEYQQVLGADFAKLNTFNDFCFIAAYLGKSFSQWFFESIEQKEAPWWHIR